MASSRTLRPRADAPGRGLARGIPLDATLAAALVDLDTRFARRVEPIAVAVSGGVDSIALLHAMAATGRTIWALSVNHGLQPQAAEWVELVRQAAEAVGARFDSRAVNVPRSASLEQAARERRYAALRDMARGHGIAVIALAQHADDLAETVLLQALRGTGIAGLAAIPVVREQGGLWWWRPALRVARVQLLDYARVHGLRYAEDPSNLDDRYRRNAVRLHLAPLLDRQWSGWRGNLARLASHAAEQLDMLEEVAAADLARLGVDHPQLGPALRLSGWAALSDARQRAVLRAWIAGQQMRAPSSARLTEMQRQLRDAGSDAQIALTHERRRLRRYRDWIAFETPHQGREADTPPLEASFAWTGQAEVRLAEFGGILCFSRVDTGGELGIAVELLCAHPLSVRRRHGAERLAPHANRPSKTLKNLFQQAGIPVWQRGVLPLLWSGDRLLWVAGLGADSRYACAAGPRVRIDWRAGTA